MTGTLPIAVRAPVRASKVPGPRVITPSPGTGRAVGATDGVRRCAAWTWPQATTWSFGAHGASAASTARTVQWASPAGAAAGGAGSLTSEDSPGASAGTARVPVSTGSPSTSYDQVNASADRPAKSCLLVIRTVPSPAVASMPTGSITFLYSTSPGEGRRSGKSRPSQTKLPSCSSSPKSPP